MLIKTNSDSIAACFSGGALDGAATTALVCEARKGVAWHGDAYWAFEDAYHEETGSTWVSARVDLLLASDEVSACIALRLFLGGGGFPEATAQALAKRITEARRRSRSHAPILPGVEVTRGPAEGGGAAREVTLHGPPREQAAIARALSARGTREDAAGVVRAACLHVAGRCAEDEDLRRALRASDWARGLPSAHALRRLPEAGPGARGDARRHIEIALMLYLVQRGFCEETGDAADHLLEAWAGSPGGGWVIALGPDEGARTDLRVHLAGGTS